MRRELRWSSRAIGDLRAIARSHRQQANPIETAMEWYTTSERGNIVQLAGQDSIYRLRVGDWRVLFTLADDGQVVLALHVLRVVAS